MKDQLIENNNSTIYGELGVKSFPRYVAAYASHLVLNLLSFLVTFLLAIILVKALMFAVKIIGNFRLDWQIILPEERSVFCLRLSLCGSDFSS